MTSCWVSETLVTDGGGGACDGMRGGSVHENVVENWPPFSTSATVQISRISLHTFCFVSPSDFVFIRFFLYSEMESEIPIFLHSLMRSVFAALNSSKS